MDNPNSTCATPHPAPNTRGATYADTGKAAYTEETLFRDPMASAHGKMTSDTTLKISHVFSNGHRFANFIGSMQFPDSRPATNVIHSPSHRCSAITLNVPQIGRQPRFSRGLVNTTVHTCRVLKIAAKMRNVLQEHDLMSECDVIEQHQVL